MYGKVVPVATDESIGAIYGMQAGCPVKRPLLGTHIEAGFPSPAQDYIEQALDLNELLIAHQSATFFVRVQGFSMVDAGIFPDDILVVDRALEPQHKSIIIAVIDGELTVKRLSMQAGCWQLLPENPAFPAIDITEESDFSVWGVVTYAIHQTR